jgi:Common central domain of tyrosinase/Polyphenol oxidase middle domain
MDARRLVVAALAGSLAAASGSAPSASASLERHCPPGTHAVCPTPTTCTCVADEMILLRGNVVGLSGKGLTLSNQGFSIGVSANGPVTILAKANEEYGVDINSDPTDPLQACYVLNGNGTATASVNVQLFTVTCDTPYTVGGTITGLVSGSSAPYLTLSLESPSIGGHPQTEQNNGPFTFAMPLANGRSYQVALNLNPNGEVCSIENGSGTIAGSNVTDVLVSCSLPAHTRQDIANLTPAQLASIARGFQLMMQRSYDNPNDPTGLTYQANMHSTLMENTGCPMGDSLNPMWDQCQHYSNLFFPWHRMYLYYFERILRAASGDPNLTLPYWNYESASEQTLPSAYTTPATPCSQVTLGSGGYVYQIGNPSANPGCNPLYLPMRALTAGVALPTGAADDSIAMTDTSFEPSSSGGDFGGGAPPGECHFDGAQGDLESQPHDVIHGAVGGIMAETTQSGNDPVFFLHHAEIDHLWKRWLAQGGGRSDPTTDATWMNSSFNFYDETGNVVTLSAHDVLDTVTQLDYRYDDDPQPQGQSKRRIAAAAQRAQPPAPTRIEPLPVNAPKGIDLNTGNTQVPIELPADTSQKISQALQEQHRILLILQMDHVKSTGGVVYEIYANLPDGTAPARDSADFVGTLGFFTAWDGSVTKSFDLTRTIRTLQDKNAWKTNQLTITFVPRGPINAQTKEPLPLEPGVRAVIEGVRLGAR